MIHQANATVSQRLKLVTTWQLYLSQKIQIYNFMVSAEGDLENIEN